MGASDVTSTTEVTVCVLGPLIVRRGGEAVDIPGPKRQAVLALLAEAGGMTVTTDALLDALWPEGPPVSARGTLQSHVSRLRAHLGPAAGRLQHDSTGYRLALDDTGTDAALAAVLLREARASEPAGAMELLERARALWRGPPLAGLDGIDALDAWSVRLRALRSQVDSAYVAAAQAAGALDVAVDAARAAVAADPLAEHAVVDLMRALAAAGRPAEALRAAYEHRRHLIEQTGLEPSDGLRDLESTIADGTPGSASTHVSRPAIAIRGRERELATLERLLSTERCVTVLGPGGVGKTTVASEVASRIEPASAVHLSAVPIGGDMTPTLADALALRVTHGDVLEACTALLGAGPRLLLLDGCEHVLASVRRVVTHLLAACPELTVLATSREPLRIAAEQRLRIGPLALTVASGTQHDASPAVAVFLDRARKIDSSSPIRASELDLVVDIVRRLDGMPLAIELAAGRLSSLGLADLHSRLDHALDVLEGGEVALRQTIRWSYDLLERDEQRLLLHLSAFPDGVDIGTAEAIAADLGLRAASTRALSNLVDASIVVRTGTPSSPRYRQLDVVRAFAAEMLQALGEAEAAEERFIRWAIDLANWIDRAIDTANERSADQTLRRELANLRAAWGTLRSTGRFDDAVLLVTGLSEAAGWRDVTEVWTWILELADDPRLDGHRHQVIALGQAASAAWSRGELARATSLAERGLAHGGPSVWTCTAALALVAISRADLSRAAILGEAAGDAATRPEQSYGVAALAAAYASDLDAADRLRSKLNGIALAPSLSAFDAYVAGEIARIRHDMCAAREHYDRAVAIARESGATFVESIATVGRLTTLAATGRASDALRDYQDLIQYWHRTGGWVQQWTTMRNLASMLLRLGDERSAVTLAVAADAAADAPPLAAHERDELIDAAISRADPAAVEAAKHLGRHDVLAAASRAIDACMAVHDGFESAGGPSQSDLWPDVRPVL